jgi:hypothetical protein
VITAPRRGFVLLSMPKCGSTSLEAALAPYHEEVPGGPFRKHFNVQKFHRFVRPGLESLGYDRSDYELVSLFREPIEWLASWWRYRQRPFLAKKRPERFTGEMSFEEFADRFLARDLGVIQFRGHPAHFVSVGDSPQIGMDRIFALDRPEAWVPWFSERVGAPLEIERLNRSRSRSVPELSAGMRARLEEFFTAEYDILERLAPTGAWEPPPGYVPAG